jgi:hypothetical protein
MLERVEEAHGLDSDTMAVLRALIAGGVIGQGNPPISVHAMSERACIGRGTVGSDPVQAERFEGICGAPYMAPLYDPLREAAEQARVCIDQFEFPNIPCAFPVVWVKAREAALICASLGKRLCDAHEWEGACEGRLSSPDYDFKLGRAGPGAIARMRATHNALIEGTKSWAYGPEYREGVCATGSSKSPGCTGGNWRRCGSNTYPSGAFPECKSALGVYDLHGNVAEHMNLPLRPEQMASTGSTELGYTEMKGSWFIFDAYRAHPDHCRWRAPYWHGSRVMDRRSHHNYHLGFRCCKTLSPNLESPRATRQRGVSWKSSGRAARLLSCGDESRRTADAGASAIGL